MRMCTCVKKDMRNEGINAGLCNLVQMSTPRKQAPETPRLMWGRNPTVRGRPEHRHTQSCQANLSNG